MGVVHRTVVAPMQFTFLSTMKKGIGFASNPSSNKKDIKEAN